MFVRTVIVSVILAGALIGSAPVFAQSPDAESVESAIKTLEGLQGELAHMDEAIQKQLDGSFAREEEILQRYQSESDQGKKAYLNRLYVEQQGLTATIQEKLEYVQESLKKLKAQLEELKKLTPATVQPGVDQ